MTQTERRERQKEYERTYRNKVVCNMDCFHCIFKDCINNRIPTRKEREMLYNAMGHNSLEYKEQKKKRKAETS